MLTPLRLVVLTGLVALVVSGVRVADMRSPLDLPVGLLLAELMAINPGRIERV